MVRVSDAAAFLRTTIKIISARRHLPARNLERARMAVSEVDSVTGHRIIPEEAVTVMVHALAADKAAVTINKTWEIRRLETDQELRMA